MDKNRLETYKEKLLKEKARIRKTIDGLYEINAGISQRENTDELSMIDNHPGDVGTEMFDKERDFALISNEKHLLADVESALKRIEMGNYGKCKACRKEIASERLDFLPAAVTCIECEQNNRDYQTYKYDRPVEEERMQAFGRYFMDDPNDPKQEVGYNSEDSWQEVEMFNVYKHYERDYDKANNDINTEGEEDEDDGYVELTDKISNQYYKGQLP